MYNHLSTQPYSNSIVKTWGFPEQRYFAQTDYRMDPIFVVHSYQQPRLENPREVSQLSNRVSYSTENRAFHPIRPCNVAPKYAPNLEFDIKQLGQTEVQDVISWCNQDPTGCVSLAKIVNSLISKMGALQSGNGEILGTCTLISENLIITARHVVECKNINELVVRFNYVKAQNDISFQSLKSELEYVVEDDPEYDYAIIKLKIPLGKVIGYAELNTEDPFPGETVLLHYPLGGNLKVSVDTYDQQTSQSSLFIRCFHDSDYCSSGGAYFDPLGRFSVMHLGAELGGDGFNLYRYAVKLQDIVTRHPNSLLRNPSLISTNRKYYLEPYFRKFLIANEGAKSQKIFTDLLAKSVKTDRNIRLTKAKIISSSEKNLDYLNINYYPIFHKVYNECLYLTGLHGYTKDFSLKYYIESDHIIPHSIWASTKLKRMNKHAKGNEARPGQNAMPAITIPYSAHRELRTTGGVTGWKEFHGKLTTLCNRDKVHKAFIKCMKEYQKNGIDLKRERVKTAIIGCLDLHIALDVIKNTKRRKVIRAYKALI